MGFLLSPEDDPEGTGLPPQLRALYGSTEAMLEAHRWIGPSLAEDPERTGLQDRTRRSLEGDTPPVRFGTSWAAFRVHRDELERVMEAAKAYVARHPYQLLVEKIYDDPNAAMRIIGRLRFERNLDAISHSVVRAREERYRSRRREGDESVDLRFLTPDELDRFLRDRGML